VRGALSCAWRWLPPRLCERTQAVLLLPSLALGPDCLSTTIEACSASRGILKRAGDRSTPVPPLGQRHTCDAITSDRNRGASAVRRARLRIASALAPPIPAGPVPRASPRHRHSFVSVIGRSFEASSFLSPRRGWGYPYWPHTPSSSSTAVCLEYHLLLADCRWC
jgi:hypothetical protein